jgi:hypothetical protein
VTWIALTAMLALALLPTLSHTLSFSRGAPSALSEVCTPQGARVVANDSLPDPSPAAFGHLEHCPFCSLHAGAWGMPPATPGHIEPLALAHAVPPLFLAAPRPLFAWSAAQPRAPPAIS